RRSTTSTPSGSSPSPSPRSSTPPSPWARADWAPASRRSSGSCDDHPTELCSLMSAQHALFDIAGPVAKRRTRLITAVSTLVLLGVLALVYRQLYSSGALAPSRWLTFTEPGTLRYFRGALANAALAALGAGVLAVPLGLVMALGRLSSSPILRIPATAFIEFFRAIPVLL